MPSTLSVTRSPLSAMCCAAWAWEASASSSSGGVNKAANCTAAKTIASSAQAANVEGVECLLFSVSDLFVMVGTGTTIRIAAGFVAHRLKTLHEDREVTRLGASVFDSGLVSPEAMAATLRALKRFQRAVQAHGVDQIRVVATSAMRDARNAAAFHAWVKAETGWNMETISGLEEGRLIHRGLMNSEPGVGGR